MTLSVTIMKAVIQTLELIRADSSNLHPVSMNATNVVINNGTPGPQIET